MDRGGRGHGGRGLSRQSSSLPRTLHGSLLQPEAEAAAESTDAYGEPQQTTQVEGTYPGDTQSYASYYRHTRITPTQSTPIAPALPSYAYEDSSYPDTTGVQRSHTTSYERSLPQESPQPTHPLPPIHTPAQHYRQPPSDAPAISTYSSLRSYDNTTPNQPSTPHQYNIPIPQYSRIGNVPLPSISIIQGPPQPGPSSYPPQRYTTQQQTVDHRQRRWMTQHTDRPMAPLPRTATSHAQQQAQQVPLGWSSQYSGASYPQYRGMQQTQSDMGDWSAGTRHNDVPQQSSRYTPSHRE